MLVFTREGTIYIHDVNMTRSSQNTYSNIHNYYSAVHSPSVEVSEGGYYTVMIYLIVV